VLSAVAVAVGEGTGVVVYVGVAVGNGMGVGLMILWQAAREAVAAIAIHLMASRRVIFLFMNNSWVESPRANDARRIGFIHDAALGEGGIGTYICQ
jgi:hypothetical protein